mmetsp:Transcript_26151/g.66576  ORF Transcript_26151/g.66576 Transcript_26151/m.66576 type:complete len:305 (-) Transcript_26151:309-1223(-)
MLLAVLPQVTGATLTLALVHAAVLQPLCRLETNQPTTTPTTNHPLLVVPSGVAGADIRGRVVRGRRVAARAAGARPRPAPQAGARDLQLRAAAAAVLGRRVLGGPHLRPLQLRHCLRRLRRDVQRKGRTAAVHVLLHARCGQLLGPQPLVHGRRIVRLRGKHALHVVPVPRVHVGVELPQPLRVHPVELLGAQLHALDVVRHRVPGVLRHGRASRRVRRVDRRVHGLPDLWCLVGVVVLVLRRQVKRVLPRRRWPRAARPHVPARPLLPIPLLWQAVLLLCGVLPLLLLLWRVAIALLGLLLLR